jgi:hypothetical protein
MNRPIGLAKVVLASVLSVLGFSAAASPLPQSIAWSTPKAGRVLLLDQDYPLAATASSGLPVSFRVDSGPAYLHGDAVTATNIGAIFITAEQAGDANYAPARETRIFNPLAGYLDKLSQWPAFSQGPLNDLKVSGTKAYAALEYSRLAVFDVGNSANPVLLSSYAFETFLEDPHLELVGSHLYVAGGRFGLWVMDITDPARPVLLASHPNQQALRLQFNGSHLWLVDGYKLQALDVANPENPVPVGSLSLPFCRDLKVVGSLVYTACGGDGISIIDIHDPSKPMRLGSLTSRAALTIEVAGSFLYATDAADGVYVIDVSRPTQPVLVGTYHAVSLVNEIRVVGSIAYAACFPTGLQVLDVSNPAAPGLLGRVPSLSAGLEGLEVVGSTVYLADGKAGLQIADASNPRQPVRLGGFATLTWAQRVDLVDNLALVSGEYGYDDSQEMETIDVTDPAHPVRQPVIHVGGLRDTEVVGTRLYGGLLQNWLRIFDFSNPAQPSLLGEFDPTSLGFESNFLMNQRVFRVRTSGNLVYLANGIGGLQIIDVTVPAQPLRVGGYNNYQTGSAYDLKLLGTRAYLAAGSYGLDILNVSDPGNLVRLGRFPRPGTTSTIALVGDRAYLGGTGPTQIVDVSDPANMRLVNTLESYAKFIQIAGSRAFAGGGGSMQVYDIQDPDHPVPLVLQNLPMTFSDFQLRGNLVYAACEVDGFQIFKYREGARQSVEASLTSFRPFVGETVEVTATASSGLPVDLRILSGAQRVTLNGSNVTFRAPGDVLIELVQPGNEQVFPASLRLLLSGVDRPALQVTYSNSQGKLEIRWPALVDPLARDLQSTDDLAHGTWQPVSSPAPRFEDPHWVLEIGPSSGARFFRLAR